MTFDKWVQDNIGRKIDYDGVYGVQCVDLAKHFIKNVLGITPISIGNAKEYWNKRNSTYIKNNFVAIKNTSNFIPRQADIFVRTSGSYGHIGVCNGDSNTSYFCAYEQNYYGNGDCMTRMKHTNWATINFLRPKKQYVCANGGLHYYKSLSDKLYSGIIDNGEQVEIIKCNCGEKMINNKKYQMQQVKYKGKKVYVADEFFKVGK